ncbi:MAG: hypothetical protein Q9220_003832 [cf. Caloplaca sp. 1 TL-2023]
MFEWTHNDFNTIQSRQKVRARALTASLDIPSALAPSISKRADAANLPAEFRTFALEHGWSITVTTVSAVTSLTSNGVRNVHATQILGTLYTKVQAICAAKMLSNSAYYQPAIAFGAGRTHLQFQMHRTSQVQEISWAFIYYFTQYMLVWVEHGFAETDFATLSTGFGSVIFDNRQLGISMLVSFYPG